MKQIKKKRIVALRYGPWVPNYGLLAKSGLQPVFCLTSELRVVFIFLKGCDNSTLHPKKNVKKEEREHMIEPKILTIWLFTEKWSTLLVIAYL